MDDRIFDQIQDVDLKKTMETSYIDYAMSVIVARALPDVRDGLKPVQRRILWSMIELNNGPDKPHRKCARIVGDTMGKYHPHGDSSIYGALVNMAQDWSMRYTLVDGHGNFGSVDGDSPAAMRYTEARLSKISMEMLADINKDTVDFIPNFDDTEKEPSVLPSRIPNLLVNGTTGIAVGMATNMPPHNLREVINACVRMIDNDVTDKETTIDELLSLVEGPDFPTGALILGRRGIEEAYRTGRGKVIVQAVTRIETKENGKSQILVSELPYLVNKAKLIENIAELVKNKKIDGITGLNDHSSREGMEICIDVRKDANPNVVLNHLYKHTKMRDTFGVINLALVNGVPKVMNLKELLVNYLKHQEEVVTRRTRYDLNKAEERDHILQGLLIALDNIDEVINIIRSSPDVPTAKATLIERFALTEAQAQAIVDMRLRALAGLERQKIENEHRELQATIARLKEILADRHKLLMVIRGELLAIAEKYGDDRRTKITYMADEISMEDLVPDNTSVITATQMGYIKRMSLDTFKAQNRGGRGIRGTQTIENDNVVDVMVTTNHHYLLCLTNKGRAYRMKAYQIPEAGRNARGTAMINLLQLMPEEYVTAVLPLREFPEDQYLFMATRKGIVKKTPLAQFANVRKTGLQAMTMTEDDELIGVRFTDGNAEVLLVSHNGMGIRFHEKDVRPTGRSSMGVRGMALADDDYLVSAQLTVQGNDMLLITEKGMGKRTDMSEFHIQGRAGKGVKYYNITEKTGKLVGGLGVFGDEDILIITEEGVMIRTEVESISRLGRVTSGVKVMNLAEGVTIANFAKVRPLPEEAVGDDISEEDLQDEIIDVEDTDVMDDDIADSDSVDEAAQAAEMDIPEGFGYVDSGIDKLLDAAEKDQEDQ
ncbi:MAG: DNA gyrase subunit A [Lachnospiraceae bacterium]|nr:DNA gyrase subunit A [Candidatus Equihabitans merdae]